MHDYMHHSCFRAVASSIMLSFLPMLVPVISTIVVVRPTLAQNGASQTAPPSQADPGYWTPERMREAKPAMPAARRARGRRLSPTPATTDEGLCDLAAMISAIDWRRFKGQKLGRPARHRLHFVDCLGARQEQAGSRLPTARPSRQQHRRTDPRLRCWHTASPRQDLGLSTRHSDELLPPSESRPCSSSPAWSRGRFTQWSVEIYWRSLLRRVHWTSTPRQPPLSSARRYTSVQRKL
jgi:hypothetical protein